VTCYTSTTFKCAPEEQSEMQYTEISSNLRKKNLPIVATYPSAGGRARLEGASSTKGKCARVATNFYSRKTLEKSKKVYEF